MKIELLQNGNLKLVIEGCDNLDGKFWSTMLDLFEPYSCNGSYTLFDASTGNPFVGLTSAPCIAESMDYLDNGDCHIVGRLWFFSRYELECPLDLLREQGFVIFTEAT